MLEEIEEENLDEDPAVPTELLELHLELEELGLDAETFGRTMES